MATLEQIQAKMDKLKAQAEALAAKNARVIVDKIRGLMAQHGLTTKDLEGDVKTKRAAKGVKASAANTATASKKSGGKVAAKYQDPKSGATWTGRGRAPAWIASAKNRSKFLIDAASAAVVADQAPVGNAKGKGKVNAAAAKKAASVGATAVRKGQPKGEQPAKYRDPKSGATWSGRGRAPLWIAGAKDRNKFLIDGAQVAASVVKAEKPKAAVKKAAATKAATTKAAATKAAPTKAATTKAPTTKAVATKTATAKAPAAKKVSAAKKVEVAPAPAPAASEKPVANKPGKVVAKKPAVSAKPKAVKKAPVAKTAEADVVAAAADVPAAPVASAEVAA